MCISTALGLNWLEGVKLLLSRNDIWLIFPVQVSESLPSFRNNVVSKVGVQYNPPHILTPHFPSEVVRLRNLGIKMMKFSFISFKWNPRHPISKRCPESTVASFN